MLPFELFNINIDYSAITLWAVLIIVSLALVVSIINYFLLKGMRYEFKNDRLNIRRVAFFIMIYSKQILYENISKVSFNNNGLFNTFFRSGEVVLELNNNKKIKLEFINNPEQTTSYIQKQLKRYKQLEQAKFSDKHKVDGIIDEF